MSANLSPRSIRNLANRSLNASQQASAFNEPSHQQQVTTLRRSSNPTSLGRSRDDSHIGIAELFRRDPLSINNLNEYVGDVVDLLTDNDAPVLLNNRELTLTQGDQKVITRSLLRVTDTDNTSSELTFTLRQVPRYGNLLIGNRALEVGQRFTQTDIDRGRLRYFNNGRSISPDSFRFIVSDGVNSLGVRAFGIRVNPLPPPPPINRPPVLNVNQGLTLNAGETGVINSSFLTATDPESDPSQVIYRLETTTSNGTVFLNGTAISSSQTFTQADINTGLLTYQHNGTRTNQDGFRFSLTDGNTTIRSLSFNIGIILPNLPPTLAVNTGLTVTEGAIAPISNTALQTTDAENGSNFLFYQINQGVTHGTLLLNNIPLTVGQTFTQADIDNNQLRYQHDGTETNQDSFGFVVTDGAATITGSFALNINLVNDAPVLINNTGLTLTPGTSPVIGRNQLLATDEEQDTSELIYTVTELPINGFVRRNGTALQVGDTFTQNDIDAGRITYRNLGGVRRLTGNGVEEAQPQTSGLHVAWRGFDGNDYEIYFHDLATGTTRRLSNNLFLDIDPQISGSNLIWHTDDGENDVYFFNGSTGQVRNITNGAYTAVRNAEISRSASEPSGTKVVFQGKNLGENDLDIFLYDAITNQITQLSNSTRDDINPQVNDRYAIWQEFDGNDYEIVYLDLVTGVKTQLTNNDFEDRNPKISASGAIFLGLDATQQDVFFYDRLQGTVTNLSNNPFIDTDREVDREGPGVSVTWRSQVNNQDFEVFLRNGTTGQLLRLTDDSSADDDPHTSLTNVAWTSNNDGDNEIFFYNGITGDITQLSNNAVDDIDSQISRYSVVWRGQNGADYDVFFANTGTSDRFGFTLSDSAGGVLTSTFNFTIG
ncbi:MAG: cadherin-like domain-containing protein [Oculatellaceae cyanobacterium bins.114]|nr:cadherin-like domain-containing protein [Oculatellaceae cyanobacterium bins.114]